VIQRRLSATRSVKQEVRRFADAHLMDLMHGAGFLTDRQHNAACRLYGLWIAGGMAPRSTMRLQVLREALPDDADGDAGDYTPEDARDVYNALLVDMTGDRAHMVDNLMHGIGPSWRLGTLCGGLDWLADVWGMERA